MNNDEVASLRLLVGGDGTVVDDSVVNDVRDPTIFVVFHDAAAYPEYVITFQ